MESYILPDKNKLRHIPISEFADLINADYDGAITDFLVNEIEKWIFENFDKTIKPNDLMPSKQLMSDLLDISVGTVQNIYRKLENKGLLYSKQCIGTLIADIHNKSINMRKSFSKRDLAVELIKKFIKKNKFKKNMLLPSVRAISKYIGMPVNTTNNAMENLVELGIIEKTANKDLCWVLKNDKFEINVEDKNSLITNVIKDLKKYIKGSMHIGDKLPTHKELAEMFKVGVKTIHSAIEILTNDGIVLPKRGRYGTCVVKIPSESNLQPTIESAIFAKSKFTAKYHYDYIQRAIENLIIENYSVNSKLPSIVELSKMMDVSPNTIRKAFSMLAKEGYLTSVRGKYGGTFVKKLPQNSDKNVPFEWVAVNPKYADFCDN